MPRVLLLLAAVSLLVLPAPGQAQVTADQLNKLSLEALTAPPPRAPAARRRFVRSLHQASARRGSATARARQTSYHTKAAPSARHPSTVRRGQFAHR